MVPKPKHKRHVPRARNNPIPTEEDICRYCETPYAQTHEAFEGTGRRQLSIRYGMQVKLCNRCHREVHEHPLRGKDLEIKQECQTKFITQYGYEMYMKLFGRDYFAG